MHASRMGHGIIHRRTRIYRERWERFQDNCIFERDSHGGSSVMVWAGVS